MNARRVLLLAIASLLAAVPLPGGAEDRVSLPDKKDFHLYLLIGQSNMAGRGDVDPAKNVSHRAWSSSTRTTPGFRPSIRCTSTSRQSPVSAPVRALARQWPTPIPKS